MSISVQICIFFVNLPQLITILSQCNCQINPIQLQNYTIYAGHLSHQRRQLAETDHRLGPHFQSNHFKGSKIIILLHIVTIILVPSVTVTLVSLVRLHTKPCIHPLITKCMPPRYLHRKCLNICLTFKVSRQPQPLLRTINICFFPQFPRLGVE